MPLTPKEADDFFFFVKEDPDEAAELIVDLVAARIPNKFGLKPTDIQVLSPMYRSSTGVTNLNARLQEKLNPPSPKKAERKLASTLLTQHYLMLQRNLLYTAITRARKLVVLVGSQRALGMAVHNNKPSERYSGLKERLNLAHTA